MFKRFFKFFIRALLWFLAVSFCWVLLYKYVPVPYTPLMVIRYVESNQKLTIKHDWVSIENISKSLQLAVICAEDQTFLAHNGFNYKAIEKAYKNNTSGNRIKGGSTISQQTAKNVFLWPDRSWLRKGLEVWFTFLIEQLWSKERILEVYLNSIEMGNGVFGAEVAAAYWFNKKAANLSQDNAAAIAAILPNPRNFRASPSSSYIEIRKAWIVKQMRNFGTFNLLNAERNKSNK
ncbi:monofunctional biosynthetic peptidoglycan transglycosylase [Cochleicola gelatinilyticus]|uniref:Biosynthetic peptidoglycan transglycosylase n=1 Tax=Cochleicola gelatinilyticus TaxID=1763537 RepID=A0A167J2Z6_9FLAO|nr:monofunctional biosynthetic peptidoglycan transglycosylase [Cochleicola gelatinilyticus]OAB80282.1 monofunctional biosynthetic peptidoglycan transglycosylase [Cochleicola gelatinilyticus]